LNHKSRYKSTKDLYPQHHGALELAGLVPKYVPMLQEVLDLNNGKKKWKEEKLEQSRHFCIGCFKLWKEPIHKWLKKLRKSFDLKWL
jgi:hypothetical protein